MSYVVVFLATRWGSELGGLNVFNAGLAQAVAEVLPKGSRCICYVETLPQSAAMHDHKVEVRLDGGMISSIVEEIAQVTAELTQDLLHGVLIVGHDIKTGDKAIKCANTLRTRLQGHKVASAVISHMDYVEYGHKKGHSVSELFARMQQQHRVVAEADHAFSVGPLLQAAFQSARGPKSPSHRLIPGAANVIPDTMNSRAALWFFLSGRLSLDDDPIKNGTLALEAVVRFYQRASPERLQGRDNRGKFFAIGVEHESSGVFGELKTQAANYFEIHPVPFTNQQDEVLLHLKSCHVALMPSWHEGFGLSGWEALCAGVPLVCSRQSGLAMLLDELRQQLPETSFYSVEFVNLTGSEVASKRTSDDVDKLADAIDLITQDMHGRKQAALALAKRLRREFTWERTAAEMLQHTGWDLPSSVRWRSRQRSAQLTPSDSSDLVEDALESLGQLDLDRDWEMLCSAFNYLSDVGKEAQPATRQEWRGKLAQIGSAIIAVLFGRTGDERVELVDIRNSGLMDICWRYMAACASLASSFAEFSGLIQDQLFQVISDEPFLRRELLFYASRFSDQFEQSANSDAIGFFGRYRELLDVDGPLQTRLARLNAVFPGWSFVLPASDRHEKFHREAARCRKVGENSHNVGELLQSEPDLGSTILALMSLKGEPARQVTDQAIEFIKENQGTPIKLSWRGDKRLAAALLSTVLGAAKVLDVLHSMANDEDESVRWAALDLVFSPTLRTRLHAAALAKVFKSKAPVNEQLGQIVDCAVVHDGGHPWLNREFLQHFIQERVSARPAGSPSKMVITDFPLARRLVGPIIGESGASLLGSQHPEVRAARRDLQARVKRVLLILPPIELPGAEDVKQPSKTSTPPLGMGLLASYVASLGHDVQISDCHRYPQLCTWVKRYANTFELIGFNTVLSTVRSTVELLKELRKRALRTILVVGGPAAKLAYWKFTLNPVEVQECWDFSILANPLANLDLLLEALDKDDSWPSSATLLANSLSPVLSLREIHEVQVSKSDDLGSMKLNREPEWKQINLDRRVFAGPEGGYEPAKTRSKTRHFHEAHVVMSQGCDWNCVFCTERKSLSGGEVRRSVERVLSELQQLSERYEFLRIQFVDDNLLPQIAQQAGSVQVALSIQWAEDFLSGLQKLRSDSDHKFGWRGILRLEDYFEYETRMNGGIIGRLSASGCTMLAFGIETGDDDKRKVIKQGSSVIVEKDIRALFHRLQAVGIHTKAYFMLGGHWENLESAQKTIKFAVESGATLAYFALFKDFVPAVQELSQQRSREVESAAAWLDYRQLALRWDNAFIEPQQATVSLAPFKATAVTYPITDGERRIYTRLSELGFSFTDLVKYNDYHSESGPSLNTLLQVTWNEPDTYFALVEQAYRKFYLRPEFVDRYTQLLESGY